MLQLVSNCLGQLVCAPQTPASQLDQIEAGAFYLHGWVVTPLSAGELVIFSSFQMSWSIDHALVAGAVSVDIPRRRRAARAGGGCRLNPQPYTLHPKPYTINPTLNPQP